MGVRVGGGQGFYGDTPAAVAGLLDAGVEYLCLEALAELTLAILQKDRQKDETRGFTKDLPAYLPRCAARGRGRPHQGHHERRGDQPGRRGASRDRHRARARAVGVAGRDGAWATT